MLARILDYIQRLYISRASNRARINYYRKQGIKIGDDCLIGDVLVASEPFLVEIGDHVAMANDVTFITHDGGLWCYGENESEFDVFGRIRIGNNVHIGMKCIFLPNTSIGDNCIIGAGSVVRGNFADNSVIVGNPAQVVTKMHVQKFIYSQSFGRVKTAKIPFKQKVPMIKKHFGIE
jgi:acetyltransferase-like isoleucine patch superfamily enzyme